MSAIPPWMLVLLVVVALAFVSATAQQPAQLVPSVCGDRQLEEHIRLLTHESLDEAFKDYIENLYLVWMKDEKNQPQRASSGVQQAISAYVRGRKMADGWKLPPC